MWGHECQRTAAFAGIGDRKPAAEANVRRIEFGSQGTEGYHRKKAVKPDARRKMAAYAIEAHQTSERRACRLAALSRNGYRYVSKKANDGEIQGKLARIAEAHPRWGFRKMAAYLRKQGNVWNHIYG